MSLVVARRRLVSVLSVAAALSASLVWAAPSPEPVAGISENLAPSRAARISNVRYELSFELARGLSQVEGRLDLSFDLADPSDKPVVLDFDGAALTAVELNGRPLPGGLTRAADHWLLGREATRVGENRLRARFRAPVAAAGAPLTVYRDPANGDEYLYTLLVPADAHRLFPCFDQPDIKARFTLEVTAPAAWSVVANGAEISASPTPPKTAGAGTTSSERVVHRFAETPPLSTYLFAFAAGPFAVIEALPGSAGVPRRIFVRPGRRQALDTAKLFDLEQRAVAWLEDYFATPYPFSKLDQVLIPSFPYGGMEHAGAIFYREDSLAFDHRPTDIEETNRSTLVYHEVTHQWFGNLVTMRWFDDLWLKEGFANLMAYELLDHLEPSKQAWLRFHQRLKQSAYRIDVTRGTTPVWQQLANLADAKGAYGEIVYDKAPAVLRELEAHLGADVFRDGLRRYLAAHAWGNARWSDLVQAWKDAGADGLDRWSKSWVLTPGMPVCRAEWTTGEDGKVASFTVRQHAAQGGAETWPLDLEILAVGESGHRLTVTVRTDQLHTEVPELIGTEAPAWVLLDPGDKSYGRFLLDPRSAVRLLEAWPAIDEPMLSAVAFSALWETTREAELDPLRFGEAALALLQHDTNPAVAHPENHARVLAALTTTVERYLEDGPATDLRRRTAALLRQQLDRGLAPSLVLDTFRGLVRLARDPEDLAWLRAVLDGERKVPGLELGTRDRFEALAPLFAAEDASAADRLAKLAAEHAAEDVARYQYAVAAAAPSAAVKARYFASYLHDADPPESWVEQSLDFFHWPGQESLTAPFLQRALEWLPWVKQHRKIFFLPAWIDAFVNGSSSKESLQRVDAFLHAQPHLDADVRRKILQSLDPLERAVRIRAKARITAPAAGSPERP